MVTVTAQIKEETKMGHKSEASGGGFHSPPYMVMRGSPVVDRGRRWSEMDRAIPQILYMKHSAVPFVPSWVSIFGPSLFVYLPVLRLPRL